MGLTPRQRFLDCVRRVPGAGPVVSPFLPKPEVVADTLRGLAEHTHMRGGLFWYHNCGLTRQMILSGRFNLFDADVIETLAPPPEGDNDLVESRRALSPRICSKGNLSLGLLRDGGLDEVVVETHRIAEAVRGYAHIYSTADAVLPGTPPQNLIAFVRTAQEAGAR